MEINIVNIEIDKDTPISIREKFYINSEKIINLQKELNPIIEKPFFLSTCNRTSIYFTTDDTSKIDKVKEIVFSDAVCKIRIGIEAIKHFLKVICGLESQVFAETDIAHQIKEHYKQQKNSINPLIEELINYGFSVHKEFHSSILPKIKKQKQILAKIVFENIKNFLQKKPNDFNTKTPLILIGYGFVNKAIHNELKEYFEKVWIFSDNFKKAIPKNKINNILKEIKDPVIIISATNSHSFILTQKSPIPPNSIIFDLSVPRSIDPNINQTLFDLDKIANQHPENIKLNLDDQIIIHNFLNEKVNEFIEKKLVNELNPLIKNFYETPLKIAEEKINQYYSELEKILQKFDEKEIKELLKYMSQKIVNKSLEEPIKKIKELYIQNKKKKIIVGTRGSKLALAQTQIILEILHSFFPEFIFQTKIIKTSGDKQIYTTNSFVKELEEALMKEEIDLAIHSLKDLPYKINDYLDIAAIPIRDEPNDVLITRDGKSLYDLKPNSIIGTSSQRRKKQLELLRPDLIIKEIRGNLDTRIKKLIDKEYDGIIVALAGIKRLNLEKLVSHVFSIEEMVPAVGQGAIAIQTRKKSFLTEALRKIDNPKFREEIEIEREIMGKLDLGCSYPLGANAQKKDNSIQLNYFIHINQNIIKEKINGSKSEILRKIQENLSLIQKEYLHQ